MLMDTWGNPWFNKPLEWIYSSRGKLVFNHNVNHYVPGEWSVSDTLSLVNSDGVTEKVPTIILYGYRFFQYMILYLVIGFLFRTVALLFWKLREKQLEHDAAFTGDYERWR